MILKKNGNLAVFHLRFPSNTLAIKYIFCQINWFDNDYVISFSYYKNKVHKSASRIRVSPHHTKRTF